MPAEPLSHYDNHKMPPFALTPGLVTGRPEGGLWDAGHVPFLDLVAVTCVCSPCEKQACDPCTFLNVYCNSI